MYIIIIIIISQYNTVYRSITQHITEQHSISQNSTAYHDIQEKRFPQEIAKWLAA